MTQLHPFSLSVLLCESNLDGAREKGCCASNLALALNLPRGDSGGKGERSKASPNFGLALPTDGELGLEAEPVAEVVLYRR